MVTLAIETSGMVGGVALIRENWPLGEVTLGTKETYSRRLLRSIQYLLDEAGVHWEDVDLISVSLGPGSFTGLRIGVATVKGLALATGARIIGVPTLDILARNVVSDSDNVICPVLDARRGQIYCALYTPSAGVAKRVSEYMVLAPNELCDFLPPEKEIVFLGSGLYVYQDMLRELVGDRALFTPDYLWHPRPLVCGLTGESLLRQGVGPHDPFSLVPLYIRLSEAEEKKRLANKKDS